MDSLGGTSASDASDVLGPEAAVKALGTALRAQPQEKSRFKTACGMVPGGGCKPCPRALAGTLLLREVQGGRHLRVAGGIAGRGAHTTPEAPDQQ